MERINEVKDHDRIATTHGRGSGSVLNVGVMPRAAGPFQLREVSFVMVGATFRAEVVRAAVPPNLRACSESRGGFKVTVAEEGYRLAPFTSAYVWFDLEGEEPDAAPRRFIHRRFGTWPTADTEGEAVSNRWQVSIEFAADQITARFGDADMAENRLVVRPDRVSFPCAGVDHCIADGGPARGATRVSIIPWAAEWREAVPVQVELCARAWADVTPERLDWAAVGRHAAMTLGLDTALLRGDQRKG